MPLLPRESIALITYDRTTLGEESDAELKYASGFFVETQDYGRVCVTCAHVVAKHPGPDKSRLFVNNFPATVKFDAAAELGIDVALLEVSEDLVGTGIHFHQLGTSSALNRIYYSHGWSTLPAQPNTVEFIKVWGPRFERTSLRRVFAGARSHAVWRLRNDIYDPKSGRSFSTKNFSPGWSGAPVFNVRPNVRDHRVIGVLSIVAEEEGKALAVSVEELDFLRPAEAQVGEGWFGRAPESRLQQLAGRLGITQRSVAPRYVIRFDEGEPEQKLYSLRFMEITSQPVCPPISEPPSPYDRSE